MKPTVHKLILPVIWILMLCIFASCGHNRLKTDEKLLAKQILTEEEQLVHQAELRAEHEKQLADSIAKLPKGFRFKEQRKIDQQRPPVVINIAESLDNISDLKLSDVASKIKYIRLEPVPDAKLPRNVKYKYYLMDNYLIALNIYGTHLYTKEGKFIRTIVKNQITGVEFDEKNNRLSFWNDYTLVGGGTSVWARGNNLFYLFNNNITGQHYIMEYDCSSNQLLMNNSSETENSTKISGLGNVLIDMNHGNTTPPAPRKHQGMWDNSPEGIYAQMDIFMPDRNTYIQANKEVLSTEKKNMLEILGQHGDTLATFAKAEQVKNYTYSTMRNTDNGIRYEMHGNMYLRSDFNDTVFQVIPPNRLLPVYILNLGKHKVSKQEGIDPRVSLDGKIIPQDWAETKNYIYLTFSRDNYDCPNTLRNKNVKTYHALFSKTDHQLKIVKGDPLDYDAPILANNLDGGYPVWPISSQVGGNGEIMLSLKGRELKTQVNSSGFQKSMAPTDKKEKLKQLANAISDSDDVLMIVK